MTDKRTYQRYSPEFKREACASFATQISLAPSLRASSASVSPSSTSGSSRSIRTKPMLFQALAVKLNQRLKPIS